MLNVTIRAEDDEILLSKLANLDGKLSGYKDRYA